MMNRIELLGVVLTAALLFIVGGCSARSPAPSSPDSESPAQTAEQNKAAEIPQPGVVHAFPPIPVLSKGDAAAKDLLTDGSFEKPLAEEPRAWTITPADGAAVMQVDDTVAGGKRALKVDTANATSVAITQTFKVPAQSRYELIGVALPQNVNGTLKLVAKGPTFAAESGPAPGNSAAWTPLHLVIAPPAFATELSIGLEYVASAQKIYDGPSALVLDRFKLIDRGAPTNMLNNGDFSQGATGMDAWNSTADLDIAKDQTGFTSDTPTAIKITLPGNRNLGIYQTNGGLEPGKQYVCRAYIKCDKLVGEACIELQHGEKGYQGFMQRTETLTGTQDWKWVSTEFTVPEGMTSASVFLRRPADDKSPDTPGTVWFARCELFVSDAAG